MVNFKFQSVIMLTFFQSLRPENVIQATVCSRYRFNWYCIIQDRSNYVINNI